jgi:hypothetical protein
MKQTNLKEFILTIQGEGRETKGLAWLNSFLFYSVTLGRPGQTVLA